MRKRQVVAVAGLVALVAVGLVLRDNAFWLRVLTLAMLLAGVAQSWNLLAGYAGQWSLAQLAFFGVGAYAVGIIEIELGIPLLLGLPLAVVFTGLFAAAIGYVTLRLRGHYFAIVTFFVAVALNELVRFFADYTGGQYGLTVPLSEGTDILMLHFDEQIYYYFFALLVVVVATGTIFAVGRSRLGLLLAAIRDDQEAAAALGIRVHALKVRAMAISGAMAGLSGVAYLSAYKLMDATTAFGIHNSLDPVIAGILGGAGTILGGVVGEFVLQSVVTQVNVELGSIGGAVGLVYGLVLMLVILFIPQGLLRVPGRVSRYLRSNRSGDGSGPAEGEPKARDAESPPAGRVGEPVP